MIWGDAAGFVYAGTGEGIYFALESGRIASQIAAKAVNKHNFKKEFLSKYEKEWKKSFAKLMKAGIIFYDLQYIAFKRKKTKELFTLPTDKEIKEMLSEGKVPLRAKLIWYSYKALKRIF